MSDSDISKHTPGPWRINAYGTCPDDETTANARLIAAAPAMAEALVDSLVWLAIQSVVQNHNVKAARNAFEQLKKSIAVLEAAGVDHKIRKQGLVEIEAAIAKDEGGSCDNQQKVRHKT